MNSKNEIEKYLERIKTRYSFENIESIHDEENFGDMFIKINDKNGIELHFIRDRGQGRGEIGTQKEMYLIEDVLDALDIDNTIETDDFFRLVDKFLQIYEEENSKFLEAFSPPTSKLTNLRIKKVEKIRSKNLFKN